MDAIWLCAATLLLHVLINRLFGRLHGWSRLVHWPVMQLAAMAAHGVIASPPLFWLLQWSSPLTNLSAGQCDVWVTLLAAATAACALRRRVREKRVSG